MKLFKRIFAKFHKVRFGEVYSYFESNGMLANLSKEGQFKHALIRLKIVLKNNPELMDKHVFDKSLVIEGVVGPKTKELMKHMIRKYHWDNNIEDDRLEQLNLWV